MSASVYRSARFKWPYNRLGQVAASPFPCSLRRGSPILGWACAAQSKTGECRTSAAKAEVIAKQLWTA
jgi:hypothetical protein